MGRVSGCCSGVEQVAQLGSRVSAKHGDYPPVGIRPEGKGLGDESRTGRREPDHAHSPVSRNPAELHQAHRGKGPEIPGERRRVHREHGCEAPHHGTGLAAHRDRVEQRELGGLDAERAKGVIVQAGDDAGSTARAEAETIRGHRGSSAPVGFHERCIYKEIGGRQGRCRGCAAIRAHRAAAVRGPLAVPHVFVHISRHTPHNAAALRDHSVIIRT